MQIPEPGAATEPRACDKCEKQESTWNISTSQPVCQVFWCTAQWCHSADDSGLVCTQTRFNSYTWYNTSQFQMLTSITKSPSSHWNSITHFKTIDWARFNVPPNTL